MDDLISGANSVKRGNGSAGQFSGWKRRIQLNILSAAVGSAITDGIVMIDHNILPADIWNIALNGGGDLRLTTDSEGNNRLPLEVVDFDTGANEAEIYTEVPNISSVNDTPLYLFYGMTGATQPAAAAAFGSFAVWDTASYVTVYHMEGDGNDSTSNQINSVVDNCNFVAGKLGQCADFESGASEYIEYNKLPAINDRHFTCQFWFWPESVATGTIQAIWDHDDDVNFTVHLDMDDVANQVNFYIKNCNPAVQSSTWAVTLSTWQHITVCYDGDPAVKDVDFRKNFATSNTGNYVAAQLVDYDAEDFTIGARYSSGIPGFQRFLDGKLDEFRLTQCRFSDDRLSFEYDNEDDVNNVLAYIFPLIPN